MEWFKSLKSHTVFNITDKSVGFFLSSTRRFSVMAGSVIYTSHFTVLYGAFQWPLSIVLWQKPQFVTFPILHYWGQHLSNEYPFYLFLFQSYFSLVQAFNVIFLWLTATVLLESDYLSCRVQVMMSKYMGSFECRIMVSALKYMLSGMWGV